MKKIIKSSSFFLLSVMLGSSLLINPALASDKNEYLQIDTDGDGLKDIYEFEMLNPKEKDTDKNGIPDGDEDSDRDGLTNLEEQTLGTKLGDKDSDNDGLEDKKEIEDYETKPNKFDTDGDRLNDSTEILMLESNPNDPDENGNGKLDGDEKHEYKFPRNEFDIEGEINGTSDATNRVIIRETPIILFDKVKSDIKFEIVSLDPDIEFNLSIPLNDDSVDMVLYRYEQDKVSLEPVKKQKINNKTNSIDTNFTGGGTYIVLSKDEYESTIPPSDKKANKYKKFKGKAKLKGIPLEIDGEEVTEDGTFKVKKKVKLKDNETIILDNDETEEALKEVTLEATYKIEETYDNESMTIASAVPLTLQTGKNPVIFVHGLLGGHETWGFEDRWDHNFESRPIANQNIYSYETFTGSEYNEGDVSTYSNMDIHSITGIVDDEELGSTLIIEYGYSPNVDLFSYIYNAEGLSGTVRRAAEDLRYYINRLQEDVFMDTSQDVSLVGHSMGGLVSRYLVENISTADVDRVITLGTPHFGSDYATFGDLDRDDSELWNGSYQFENDATKPYFGIAGWNPSYNTLVGSWGNLKGTYATGLGMPATSYSSWNEYINVKYEEKTGFRPVYGDLEDGPVNIDSALGSDLDPEEDFGKPSVKMNYRIMIWDDVYGQHSAMRKHPKTPYYVARAIDGVYDDNSKD